MAITKRDVEIVEWVNLHGFVLAEQVQEFFGLGKTVVYRRLKEMVEQGVLKRERILYDYGNVYW
ncbi:DeoR family transcriptional regulator, partial [Bacillus cereus group sp. BfR-BA-01318]